MGRSDRTGSTEPMSRRGVIRGAAVGGLTVPLLAACGGPEETGGSGSGATPTDGDSASGDATGPLVSTSAVPVGGGTILEEQKLVVTQPSEGNFKAFTAVCTHQGCLVASVADGQIVCPCHGSAFSVEDGANVVGPSGSAAGSTAPLAEVEVTVSEGEVTLV